MGECADGYAALEILASRRVDVVLADIHMPKMGGVELLQRVQELVNPPVFVAVTALDSDDTMLTVLRQGAAGYIVKSSRPATVITAVRDALAGGTTVSPEAMSRLTDYLGDDAGPSRDPLAACADEGLTPAEREVLENLCAGLSNSDIASRMGYSEATVKKHVSRLIKWYGASSRLELAVWVLQGRRPVGS